MKRYKIEHFYNEPSIQFLFEISKSGKANGIEIRFFVSGKKVWQHKCKNGILHGVSMQFCFLHTSFFFYFENNKNGVFQNWKKGNEQGIQIKFKNNKTK